MTDDQTQRYEPGPAGEPPAAPDDVATADAATADAASAPAAAPSATAAPGTASDATGAAVATPMTPTASAGPSRTRWLLALGIAGVAIVVGLAALLLFGKTAAPEALTYVPGDAAFVVELRPDLPGDQMQAAGNLLAHFPGFKDQSTLSQKIDEALKRIIAQNPGSSVDYEKDVKPFLSGPMFVAVHSFEDMATSSDPTDFVVVASTTGTVTCEQTFEGQQMTTETYNGLQLSVSESKKAACAVDGRFVIVGDQTGVKAAIDARKSATGLDKSARYQAARTKLGLDRLATMYFEGASFAKALGTSVPGVTVTDLAGMLPEWVIAGVRAENDALVTDIVMAPATNPSALPSMATSPPVHPLSMTAFAPAGTLVFAEIQGFGVSMHNVLGQLQSDPQFTEALKALDAFGGIDGMIGWIDDAGFVVLRDGDVPAGGIFLGTKDAATAAEKVTALTTVLGLGAVGGDIQVTTSTVEGVKVTTVHIPDISVLAGAAGAGTGVPSVPIDFSVAAKDRYVVVGIGTDVMAKLLGVKPGVGLADDAAFKRALGRGLPNPQAVVYVATGATIDWLESASAALGAPAMSADVKAYLDPIEGFIYTTAGDAQHGGSLRFSLTVANP